MNNLYEIKKKDIKKKVISEVKKAKKEILVTLDIAEERKNLLPAKYFSLLEKKHKEGIKIKRVIFGTVKQYELLLKEMKERKLFFMGKHTNSKKYKRMIMIDGTKLFFRKKIKNVEQFFFTNDDTYIKEYKLYFDKFKQ